MAEPVVSFLVNELSRVLKEEINLQSGVEQDIIFVKDELESIRAFLRVADAKQEQDHLLKAWVNQVRDIAFDIESTLDEFKFRVSDFSNGDSPRCTCLNQICICIKRWKNNRQFGFKLLTIKKRVTEISDRRQRYSGYSSSLLGQPSTSRMPISKVIDQLQRSQRQLFGISDHKQKLIDWLLQSDFALKVLALAGMAGFGKTTMAQQIYNDDDVKSQFHHRAFVSVFQSPKQEDLLRDMIHQLFANEKSLGPQGIDAMDSSQLKETMQELLQTRSYLIVLDDVESIEDWNQLKVAMPRSDSGGRVIITTSVDEVANSAATEFQGMVYNLQPLFESHSWTLFCEKIFPEQLCPPRLEPICQQVMERCAGIPLAIVIISGMLATKDVYTVEVWEMVHGNLSNIHPEEAPSQIMKKILLYSFYDLPYYLKSCFLLLSVFPGGHSIERTRLIRLWISEGFVEEKDGETLEEVAEGYFYELLNRGLVQICQMTTDGKVKSCRIHDFLREIVLSMTREQSFAAIISRRENAGNFPERLRRLSIQNNEQSNVHELNRSLLARLHSLYLFEVGDTSKLITSGCLRLLNVLDLRGASLDVFPEQISSLFLLRYLSLRNTRISMIPRSIRNLHNLETLDLKQTFITALPSEASKLQKLRYLLICHCENVSDLDPTIVKVNSDHGDTIQLSVKGFKATPEIASLISLQKLSYLEACEDNDLIMNLGMLTQLRKLCLVNLKRHHFSSLCSSILKLRSLFSLSMQITERIANFQDLLFPPLLQRLYLSGNLEKLPSWASCQQSLRVLHLVCTSLKEDPVKSLQALPNLAILLLFEAYDGRVMNVLPGYFPRVKSLSIFESLVDKRVLIHENAMPKLEQVHIQIGDQYYSAAFPLSPNEKRQKMRITVGRFRM